MRPPIKDQVTCYDRNDDPGIDASNGAIILEQDGSVKENKDLARQEHKDEADINYMLSRFGITPPRGAPQYGEWDDTIELAQALDSVREARMGYANLPQELRNKFPSMEEFLRAVENGSLVIKDEKAPESIVPTPPA